MKTYLRDVLILGLLVAISNTGCLKDDADESIPCGDSGAGVGSDTCTDLESGTNTDNGSDEDIDSGPSSPAAILAGIETDAISQVAGDINGDGLDDLLFSNCDPAPCIVFGGVFSKRSSLNEILENGGGALLSRVTTKSS